MGVCDEGPYRPLPVRPLRARRRVLIVGAVTTLVGVLFIFGCLHWLKQQPYVIPVPLFVSDFPLAHTFFHLTYLLLDMPFLLLPIAVLFFPEIHKSRSRVIAVLSAALLVGIVLAAYPSHIRSSFEVLLEPAMRVGGDWIGVHGIHEVHHLQGTPPTFLNHGVQALLAILSPGGLMGLIASFLRARRAHPPVDSSNTNSWKQLAALMAPFTAGFILLLIACAGTTYYRSQRLLRPRALRSGALLPLACPEPRSPGAPEPFTSFGISHPPSRSVRARPCYPDSKTTATRESFSID